MNVNSGELFRTSNSMIALLSRPVPRDYHFDPSYPPEEVCHILDVVGKLHIGRRSGTGLPFGPSIARHIIRSTWNNACKWMTAIIRRLVDRHHSPETPEGFRMRNKSLIVLRMVLKSSSEGSGDIWNGPNSQHRSVFATNPQLVSIAVDTCYTLADIQHPLFEPLWSQIEVLYEDQRDDLLVHARHAHLTRGYDLPRIGVRLLVSEVVKATIDTSALLAAVEFFNAVYASSPEAGSTLMSNNGLHWLTHAFRIVPHRSHTILPNDYRLAKLCMKEIATGLKQVVQGGYSFATDVVRGRTLRSMARTLSLNEILSADGDIFTLSLSYSRLIEDLSPFLIFRTFAIAVMKECDFLRRAGLLNSSLDRLLEDAQSMERDWTAFRASGKDWVCCSSDCNTPPEKRPIITLKQCSKCRVAMYCSVECQRHDWCINHRNQCSRYPTPVSGCSYHISVRDEAFMKFRAHRDMIQMHEDIQSQPQSMVIHVDYSHTRPKVISLSFEETIGQFRESTVDIQLRSEKDCMDESEEVLVLLHYPGSGRQPLVYRERLFG
ncbi:hypothetical protein VNI00_009391 [Paramarasmius palmivorus]|uniref:MYND-type domain-containing protein n=1 Tax=Paramarasmius palmivorus TaxID=297713 RepID=A0AAW0CTM2_9AGAR